MSCISSNKVLKPLDLWIDKVDESQFPLCTATCMYLYLTSNYLDLLRSFFTFSSLQ